MTHTDTSITETEHRKDRPNFVKKRIMIAGIGNMFMKDDGFGSAVVKRIMDRNYPPGVEVKDFGTSGLKLAYDLMKGYDGLIFVDASARGEKPGTIYVIEPNEKEFSNDLEQGGPIDPHGADPVTVLRFVKSIGSWPGKVFIVACEPETTDDFEIGLSDSVNASIDTAIKLIDDLVNEFYSVKKEVA